MKRLFAAVALIGLVAFSANALPLSDEAPTIGVPQYNGDTYFGYLGQIPLDMNNYCVGVGFDGTYIWVSAGDTQTGQCEFYIYDEYGNQVGNYPQGGGSSGWGHRDMCFAYDHMWGSYSYAMDAFDPGTFTYVNNFTGCINPNRALAFGCAGAFYTCGFGEYLYEMVWDEVFGSSAFCTPIGGPISGAYGLAYDCVANHLWMTTADYTGDVFTFDCMGNQTGTYTVTTLGPWDIMGGCTMVNTVQWGYILAILMQSAPDTVVFVDLEYTGPSPVEDSSWGSIKALYR